MVVSFVSVDSTGNLSIYGPRPWADLRAYGAKGDGSTDDTTAWNNFIASGASYLFVPDGTYRLVSPNAITTGNVQVLASPNAILQLGATLTFGSASAQTQNVTVRLFIRPDGAFAGPLVTCDNLLDCQIQIDANLSSTFTGDFVYIRSINGKGNTDNIYRIRNYGPSTINGQGIRLQNGSGSVASVAGDFVNGNLFEKCDIGVNGANGICCAVYPTGTVGGSVSGAMNRNYFFRCDWNSFSVNGGALQSKTAGSFNYNEFSDCTFEAASGPTYEIDLTTNAADSTGNYFRHPRVTHAYTAQKLNQSAFIDDEGFDTNQGGGISSKWYALQVSNRTKVAGATATTTSTAFVSSGSGGALTPRFLAETEISFSCFGSNFTAGNGVRVALYRNTTGVPAAGTSVGTDTQIWLGDANLEIGTNGGFNFLYALVAFLDTGLTNNTTYYYYIAFEAVTGGTAQVDNVQMLIREA